jgi:hypothetical protein
MVYPPKLCVYSSSYKENKASKRYVTPLFLAQVELQWKEEELRKKSEKLEEMNVTLSVLLEHHQFSSKKFAS